MQKLFIIGMLAATVATGALAIDMSKVDKSIPLKDGSTVYIFKDGKMAMEDKLGRTTPMRHGQIMQTKDGQSIMMVGNELARLDWLRKSELGGGN